MDVGCTLHLGYIIDRLWITTSASRTVSAVAELVLVCDAVR